MEIRIGEGVTFYLDLHPDKKRVMLILHGWGQSSKLWRAWAEQLKDYRIIIPDLPAFGRSTPLPSPVGNADYVEWVKLFIEKLVVGPVILVGHSFGGQLAVQAAVDHPKLISRLVLIAPAVVRDKRSFIKIKVDMVRLLARFKKLVPPQWAFFLASSEDWAQATPAQKKVMTATLRDDVADRLPQITQETLLVWGELDREILGNPKHLMECISQGRLKVIYGTGHNLHVEQPVALRHIIERWLDR